MLGLALETSGRTGSLALVDNGTVSATDIFPHGLKHAAEIVQRIDRLLLDQGRGPRDISELYVSAGPGSFTGLRIGITLAKTLAFATGAKLVAVPTISVLVANAPPDSRNVVIVLDAKRDQIFTALACRTDVSEPWEFREPAHLDSLGAMLGRAPRPVHLVGEGIPYHEKFIPKDDLGIIVTPPEVWRARAEVAAEIGGSMARAGDFTDPNRLLPIYIRKPEAEEKLEAKLAAAE